MARMTRAGVDYFPLDCVLDDKFQLIEAEYGLKGFSVVVKLFQRIYGGEGYYCEFSDDVALLFSKRLGEGRSVVSEIVSAAINRKIFDSDLYQKYRILTSRGIQKRYLEIVQRRKNVEMKKEYLLLPEDEIPDNVDILALNVNIKGLNVCSGTQSKVKESKVKESKVYERAPEECRHKRGEFGNVLLSDVEIQKLKEKGIDVDSLIERLDLYIGQSGKRYKSHYMTILNWDKRDKEQAASKAKGYGGGGKKPVGVHVRSDTRMSAEEKSAWLRKKLEASKTASLRGE